VDADIPGTGEETMRTWLISLAFLLLLVAGPDVASAVPIGNANVTTATDWCYKLLYVPSKPGVYNNQFVAPLVKCFTDTTQGIIPAVTNSFIVNAKADYLPVVGIMLIIAVAYYGFKLLIGDVQRIKADTIILSLKCAFIMYFMDNAEVVYLDMVGLLQQFSGIVAQSATQLHLSGFCNAIVNPPSGADNSAWQDNLWQRWDCIFGYILGLGGGSLAIYSMVSFLLLMTFTMGTGILIAVIGIYLIMTLLTAVFRFVHVYFMAMLSLSFLFCLGYMFVPLILFRNTIEYFRKWLMLVFGFVITPVLMFGFMGIMLVAIDVALFTGQYSVWCTIGGLGPTGFCQAEGEKPGSALAAPIPTCMPDDGSSITRGGQMFCNLTGNVLAKSTDSFANPNLQDAFKGLFTAVYDGPKSENPANPASITDVATKCLTGSFQGLRGYSDCALQNGATGATGVGYQKNGAPATAGVGFDQTALNLTYMATQASSSCTQDFVGGVSSATTQTYYSNCPYIEDILISMCVAALIAYVMYSLISYIPTLASNLGGAIAQQDLMTAGRSLFNRGGPKLEGSSAGMKPLDSQKTAVLSTARGDNPSGGSSGSAPATPSAPSAPTSSKGQNMWRALSGLMSGDR
jgi:hypothetical protein